MAFLADYILDLALAELDTATTTLYITSAEATTYAEASSTLALGNKTSLSIGAPADRTPNGRKVTIASFTDGTVTATDTATHWAITKDGTTLMATGALASPQAVTSGNSFTLAAFDVGIPDAV
jgi:Na+-translocating ferredoxin:NAD+ oxidoreductase RnfG subunit